MACCHAPPTAAGLAGWRAMQLSPGLRRSPGLQPTPGRRTMHLSPSPLASALVRRCQAAASEVRKALLRTRPASAWIHLGWSAQLVLHRMVRPSLLAAKRRPTAVAPRPEVASAMQLSPFPPALALVERCRAVAWGAWKAPVMVRAMAPGLVLGVLMALWQMHLVLQPPARPKRLGQRPSFHPSVLVPAAEVHSAPHPAVASSVARPAVAALLAPHPAVGRSLVLGRQVVAALAAEPSARKLPVASASLLRSSEVCSPESTSASDRGVRPIWGHRSW